MHAVLTENVCESCDRVDGYNSEEDDDYVPEGANDVDSDGEEIPRAKRTIHNLFCLDIGSCVASWLSCTDLHVVNLGVTF